MRSGPSRRTDSGGAIAETHAADGALRADKNREIDDDKDHRAFEDSPVQVYFIFFADARTRRPNPAGTEPQCRVAQHQAPERRRRIGEYEETVAIP
ncbi:hypothetical protein NL676_000407 [Syzygium grande]|nr:hypothetical protein NL676_000407 [Syzygium grande]